MSVLYELVSVPRTLNTGNGLKTKFYPRTKSRATKNEEDMIREIAMGSASKEAVLQGALAEIKSYIARELNEGYNVCINGLGTFSVTATCRAVETPKEIRAESVSVKRIVFKDSVILRRKLSGIKFERIKRK